MNKQQTANLITRRDAVKRGLWSAAGLALIGPTGVLAKSAPLQAKAKSVIQIWMWGGPAHLDTFDPKPDAGRGYCGPYDKPIATNVDGVQMEIDARPSDALALAVRADVPIYAEDTVLDKAGILLDKETGKPIPEEMELGEAGGKGKKVSEEEKKRLSAFYDFISTLDLEDFDKRQS